MDLISFPELEAVLQDLAKDVAEGYKDSLARSGRKASGDLINSVRAEVKHGDSWYEVTLTLKDYWKYVENGTRPHWPPRDAILRWIQIKPVIPRPDASGRIPSQKSLAFLISRKIATVGTEGSSDLQKTKDAVITAYRERLTKALGNDTAEYLRRVMVF